MRYVERTINPVILGAARAFPAVVLTGPRRAGKTTLLRRLFPHARYVLLEDPDMQARVRADPRGLLDELTPPVLFDEIQNAPELFQYVRSRIDQTPRRMGQWLFTASQEAPLMVGVTESMAGRAAVLQLLGFSLLENDRVSLLSGGFPETVARTTRARNLWFSSYVQTYLERDVRSITNIRDLATFRRFLALVASRHGQVLNKTDLAAAVGASVPTVSEWLHILEITGQIILVPPFFENFGKRLIKSPKVYIGDSGLACHLLGILSPPELERSPFLGALFEGFVASEIVKSQVNTGGRKQLYHFRDQQGLEVDFLFAGPGGKLWMIECKAAKTVHASKAVPLQTLGRAVKRPPGRLLIVHRASPTAPRSHVVAPAVEALDIDSFVRTLAGARGTTQAKKLRPTRKGMR